MRLRSDMATIVYKIVSINFMNGSSIVFCADLIRKATKKKGRPPLEGPPCVVRPFIGLRGRSRLEDYFDSAVLRLAHAVGGRHQWRALAPADHHDGVGRDAAADHGGFHASPRRTDSGWVYCSG